MLSEEILDILFEESIDPNQSPFGLWINALFKLMSLPTPYLPRELSFAEQKEAFFLVLERLLREKKAVLLPPWNLESDAPVRKMTEWNDYGDKSDADIWVWDIPIEDQIAYFRRVFPADAADPDDSDLNLFWYMGVSPLIGWIHPDNGKIVCS